MARHRYLYLGDSIADPGVASEHSSPTGPKVPAWVASVQAAVSGMQGEVKGLHEVVTNGFKAVDKRLDSFERRQDKTEARMDERFKKVDERFDRVDERFDKVDERFDKVDRRFEKVDQRFENVGGKIDAMCNNCGPGKAALRLEGRMDKHENGHKQTNCQKKDDIKWYKDYKVQFWGLVVAAMAAALAVIAWLWPR
mgnify:CR=1 FL=1